MNNFPFNPRDYQLNARYSVNKSLNNRNNPLLVMPTGTGKTKTAAMIIYDRIKLGEIVYIICPQVEIFDQLLKDYAFMNPGYINDEGMRGNKRSLYVCMAMSLFNVINMIPESLYPNLIISDECHHSRCNTWDSIYKFFDNALRMGMTATPKRTDGKLLGNLYNDLIEPITVKEAIEKGYLTKPIVIAPEEFTDNIPMKGDDYDMEKQAELLGECKIIGNVIDTYEMVIPGKSMLIACCTFEHAESVKNDFNNRGWKAEHIHSNLSKHDRKGMLKRLSNSKTNILTTVGIGIEGLDISGIHALAWLRRTKSITIKVQFEGRPMRLAEGKEHCYIFDFVGNTVLHGMPDRIRKWTLDGIEEKEEDPDKIPFQVCYSCGVYNAPDNLECHWCGADLSMDGPAHVCKTCGWWIKDEYGVGCSHGEAMITVQRASEISDYCKHWKGKGRKLPAMIDGKMVAITTDGEIQEIKERSEEIKNKQKELFEKEEKQKRECKEIAEMEKRKMLKEGLFSNSTRRGLFLDALGEW